MMQSILSLTQLFFRRDRFVLGVAFFAPTPVRQLVRAFARTLSDGGLVWGLAAVFALIPLSVSAEASIGPSGVSLSPTGAQHPGTPYIVSGAARNSGSDDYTGTVFYMWYYSTNGGQSWSDWSGLQYFTGLDAKKNYNLSRSGTVGPPDGNTYAFRLCVNTSPYVGGGCSSAGSITPTAKVQLYTLSVGRSGLGTIIGSGISCGSDCSESYAQGTSVSLSASPDSGNGYAFKDWSGACSGSSCSLTMNANKSVTANFIKVYNISVSAGTGGSVSCPNCGSSVQSGTSVRATATENPGYRFSAWSRGPCSGNTSPVCLFTAGSSQTMTANFTRIAYTLSTSVSSGSGTGSVSGGGPYNSGSSVEVQAIPSESDGYEFSSWGGACAGKPNPCTLTMDSNKSVSASFSRSTYSLSVSINGSGSVLCNKTACASSYPSGTSVTLTAEPSLGSVFGGWSDGCSGTASSCTVSMTQARSVIALFAPLVSSGGVGFVVTENSTRPFFGTMVGCYALVRQCDPLIITVTSPMYGTAYTPGETISVTGRIGTYGGQVRSYVFAAELEGTGTRLDSLLHGDEFSYRFESVGILRENRQDIVFTSKSVALPAVPGTYRLLLRVSVRYPGAVGGGGTGGPVFMFAGYVPVEISGPKTLPAPTVKTNTPSCTDGAGKIKVWFELPTVGAGSSRFSRGLAALFAPPVFAQTMGVSYTLHRGVTPDFIPSSANKIADFTAATAPTKEKPYLDSGLASKTMYYYKAIALSGGVASNASAAVSAPASARCPDFVVESITLPSSLGHPAGTVLSGTGGHKFGAVIKNAGEGTDASKTFFNQISVNGAAIPNIPENQPISNGLVAGATKAIISGPWTADTVTSPTTRTVEVCADQPPADGKGLITEAPSSGVPAAPPNPAETNNCKSVNVQIVPPLKATLECWDKDTQTWKQDFCIIDYGEEPQVRVAPSGSPSECAVREKGGETKRSSIKLVQQFLSFFFSKDAPAGSQIPTKRTFQAECTR